MKRVDEFREDGWYVFPGVLVKIHDNPFVKCIATIEKGRLKKIYWSPPNATKSIKRQFINELKAILRK